jgi:hypothetical protein
MRIAWSFFSLGYIKAREASIMDYVHTCDKQGMSMVLISEKNAFILYFILVQSSLPLPTIHFLSLTDCSQTLTKVAQTLCQQVKQGEINPDSIHIDTVDHCYTSRKSNS